MGKAQTQELPGIEPVMPLSEFAEKRHNQLEDAKTYKRRHCRSTRWLVFRVAARNVAPERRASNLDRWQARKIRAREQSSRCLQERMWHWFYTSGAECVKSHEGAWTSNTGNGYYGGFQADYSFQSAYGGEYLSRWGTANNWNPVYQIHMAYRGWLARGWAPWPNTSVMCGLR